MDTPYHILIIEDDSITLEALSHKFRASQFTVTAAMDGKVGMEQLRAQKDTLSVVLLDLRMPVRDGFWFLEQRKQDPALSAHPPVIVITNLTGGEFLTSALALGARGYLKKEKHSIQDIVREVLSCIQDNKCSIDD